MPISDELLRNIESNNPKLTTVVLSHIGSSNRIDTRSDFQKLIRALAKNTHITSLKIEGSGHLGDDHKLLKEDLEEFALVLQSSHIKEYRFSNAYLDKEGLSIICGALVGNPCLASLTVVGQCLDLDEIAAVSKLLEASNTLTTVNLTNCTLKDDHIAIFSRGVALSKSIKTIELCNNFSITDAGIEHLAGAIKVNRTLTKLDLTGVEQFGDKGAICLVHSMADSVLQSLTFKYTEVTDTFFKELAIALQNNFNLTDFKCGKHTFCRSMNPINKPVDEMSASDVRCHIRSLLDRNEQILKDNALLKKQPGQTHETLEPTVTALRESPAKTMGQIGTFPLPKKPGIIPLKTPANNTNINDPDRQKNMP